MTSVIIRVHIHWPVCVFVCTYMYVYTGVCVCVCVCVCACVHVQYAPKKTLHTVVVAHRLYGTDQTVVRPLCDRCNFNGSTVVSTVQQSHPARALFH